MSAAVILFDPAGAKGRPPRATPAVPATPRDNVQRQQRAAFVAHYAAGLGVEVLAADILEASDADAALTLAELAQCLGRLGQDARVQKCRFRAGLWPAMVQMTSGDLVLVLGQEGRVLTVCDADAPERRRAVTVTELARMATGRVLTLKPATDRGPLGWDLVAKFRAVIGGTDTPQPLIRRERLDGRYLLTDVAHRYDDDSAPVLDLPKLSIIEGQHVALLGANGAGKSTLLRLMAGVDAPSQGRVLLDGIELNQLHGRDLRRGVGYLAQDVALVAGTLRDNLTLTQSERCDARLRQALDFAGLGAFVTAHPKGLDLPVQVLGQACGQGKVVGLSAGQQRCVGLARLWLADPRIVLLDDPTAALDPTLEATMASRLRGWLAGRTAVIATQRPEILSLCDRVIVLQRGKMAVDGPRDEVLAHLKARDNAAQSRTLYDSRN